MRCSLIREYNITLDGLLQIEKNTGSILLEIIVKLDFLTVLNC